MALRISNALRNFTLQNGSFKKALQNGKIFLYTGAQVANPEAAPTGTLLCTYTVTSGAHTSEVLPFGTVTLAGTSGSVNTLTVDGISVLPAPVTFTTSLTQVATDIAAAINKGMSEPEYTATASGAVVTIIASRGAGASGNGLVIAAGLTTLTATIANTANGVTAINGLQFQNSLVGTLSKDAAQIWSGIAGASGTAGWFRFVGAVADSGLADGDNSQIRLDGNVGTTGSDLNLTSTAIAATATQTISGFSVTLPAA